MKVYIAGPMTGYPQFNIPAFDALADELRATYPELEVVSPAELDDPETRAISLASEDGAIATLVTHGQTWADFLGRDVKLIADSGFDFIIVLPGWEKSRGARLETFVATALCAIPTVEYVGGGAFHEVPPLELFKAWTGEIALTVYRPYGTSRKGVYS